MITTVNDVKHFLIERGFNPHRFSIATQSHPPAVIISMKYFWFNKKKLENDIWVHSVPGVWVVVRRWSLWKWFKYIFLWDDNVLGRGSVSSAIDAPLTPGLRFEGIESIGLTANEAYQNFIQMVNSELFRGLGITPPNSAQKWEERWRKK